MQSGLRPLPAEEGLPGGEPLLLRHLEMCRAGLEADCKAIVAGVAPAAAPVSLEAGVSHWARVTSDALLALGRLWDRQGAAPSASAAAAVLRATMQLLGHEVATREPLPLSEAATAESDIRLHSALSACLRLRGAAAAAAQRSLLQQLAIALSLASDAVTTAFSEPEPGGASELATAEALAPYPAAPAASTHLFALPPPREGSATASAQARLPPGAASDLELAAAAAMTSLANSAHCVARVNAICSSSQGPQFVLAPESESGHDWAMAIAATLGTIACWFTPHAGSVPNDVLMTAFTAGSCLAGAAIPLLRRRIAAGLEALQQAAGLQLVDGLAAYVACESQPILVAAAHVRSCSDKLHQSLDCIGALACLVGTC